jgi:hypothetical protein
MTDLSSQVLSRMKEFHLESLPRVDDFILPYYEGFSLVNIPVTITRLLGVPDFGKMPLDELILRPLGGGYKKVLVLLVDALGYHLLNQMMMPEQDMLWGRFFDQAVFSPITSVCPSTTASALTTFWTGIAPAAHGIIGYEMWSKEFGMLINNILHSPASARADMGGLSRSGFDPQAFLNQPVLGTHLQEHGVSASAFIHKSIARSGLSEMHMKDVNVCPYVDEADLCVSLTEHVNSREGVREFIYVYYNDIDTLIHRYNADDARVSLQFKWLSSLFESAFISNLSTAVAKDTLLILTADHGSKNTPINPQYDLVNHPELLDQLVMQPTCEHRFAIFYIKQGRKRAVCDYFKNTWPEEFLLIEPEVALEGGLFGKIPFKENLRDRLGDLIAVARGEAFLWWPTTPNIMLGRHGGLSREEMLVPFYALTLGELGQAN